MTDDSYVFEGPADEPPAPPRDNNPPQTVSELSFALKRTLEDRFGHVRLRGEISKVNHHASGHVYLTLKDDKAAIDGVIWKGSVRGLGVRPESGLEVIVTGKITSYPARSSYQIVIETMEAAGAGALLAQLERLKAKLAGEGLFEPGRKTPIPAFPAVVGVITSPTGAVIRDILHRISERWPCRVIVWPCVVQGDAAAGQVAAAIRGFDAMTPDGPIPRPDVVIVARGGGSVEDLWAPRPGRPRSPPRFWPTCRPPSPISSAVSPAPGAASSRTVAPGCAPPPAACPPGPRMCWPCRNSASTMPAADWVQPFSAMSVGTSAGSPLSRPGSLKACSNASSNGATTGSRPSPTALNPR